MTEIVDTDMGQAGGSKVPFVAAVGRGIAENLLTTAHAEILGKRRGLPLALLAIGKNRRERSGHLQITIRGFVFRRRFYIAAFEMLGDAAPNMDDVSVNIAPTQGVDLTFAHTGVEDNCEKHIKSPVAGSGGVRTSGREKGKELISGIVAQGIGERSEIHVAEVADR